MINEASLFSSIFADSDSGLLLVAQDGQILASSRGLQNWLGYDSATLQAMTLEQLAHPEDTGLKRAALDTFVNGMQDRYLIEQRFVHHSGTVVRGRVTVSCKFTDTDDNSFVCCIIEDVAARHQLAAAARSDDAAQGRAMLAQAALAVALVDADGSISDVNPAFGALLGYDPAEAAGLALAGLLHPEDVPPDTDGRADHTPVEGRLRHKDGQFVWVRSTIVPLAHPDEPAVRAHILEDLQSRSAIEGQLQKIFRAYQTLTQANLALEYVSDDLDTMQRVCRAIVNTGGYVLAWVGLAEQDEQKSVHVLAFAGKESGYLEDAVITWADNEQGQGPTGTAIRTGKPAIVQHIATDPQYEPWRAAAIQRGYASSVAIPLLASERAFGALNIYAPEPDAFSADEVRLLETLASNLSFAVMSMRARELAGRAEQKTLDMSEARYQRMAEKSNNLIYRYRLVPPVGFVYVSPAATTITGYTPEEHYADPQLGFKLVHPDDRILLEQASQGDIFGESITLRWVRKDGTIIWTEQHNMPIMDAEGNVIALEGVARDVTQRYEALAALRLQNEAVNAAANAIIITDPEGTIISCNPAFSALTGYSKEECIGRNQHELVRSDAVNEAAEHVVKEMLLAGKVWHGQSINRRKDGTLYVEEQTITPVLDEQGDITHFVAIKQDITDRKRIEQDLQASETRYRQIVEATLEGIWRIDRETRTTFVTDRMAEMLGYDPAEMLGMPLVAFVDEAALHDLAENLNRGQQGIAESREFTFRRKDGSALTAFLSTTPMLDEDGNYAGAQALVTDISDLKAAQAAEHEQRMLAEAMRDTNAALIAALDFDDVLNTILENLARVLPHDGANIMLLENGHVRVAKWRGDYPGLTDTLQEQRIALVDAQHVQTMLTSAAPFLVPNTEDLPSWIPLMDDDWVKSHMAAPIQSRGNVIGFLNVDSRTPGFFTEEHIARLQTFADQASVALEHAQLYEEISQHAVEMERQVEDRTAALQHSQARYRSIVEDQVDMVARCLPGGVLTFMNRAYADFFQCEPEDLIGTSFFDLLPDALRPVLESHTAVLNKDNPVASIEYPLPRPDGKSRWLHWIDRMVFDEQGSFVEYQGVGRDITEQKLAVESRKLSDQILTHMGEGVHLVRAADGIIVYTNPVFEQLFGYEPGELLGQHVSILNAPSAGDPMETAEQIMADLRAHGSWQDEIQNVKKDGTVFWSHAHITTFDHSEHGPVWVAIHEDITERKQAEESRKLSEQILTHMGEGVLLVSAEDGVIVYTNPSFDQLFGYEPDELLGQHVSILNAPDAGDPRETAEQIMTDLRERGTWQNEIQNVKKDGTVFWSHAHVTSFDHSEYGPVWVAIHEDITKRKQIEVQLRQMMEHEMELHELKSRYLAMAAHDLRNPLAVIQNSMALLERYSDKLTEEKKQANFNRVRASIGSMVELLDDIMTLGRVEAGKLEYQPTLINLVEFCYGIVAEQLQTEDTDTRTIHFTHSGVNEPAVLDPKLLRHILRNLLSNALKYSPKASSVEFSLHADADDYIFEVRDYGFGIPEEDQAQVFEVFHRAENIRHLPGSGLGLAIVNQSVSLHGGQIAFESEEGAGTLFRVSLPRMIQS